MSKLYEVESTLLIECKAQINLVRNIKLISRIDEPAQRLTRECTVKTEFYSR